MEMVSPSVDNIESWLNQSMVARGGGVFTPSDDYWRPDPTAQSANVAEAKYAVERKIQPWLISALAYYAKERSARTLKGVVSVLMRCANAGFDVLNEHQVIEIRNCLSERDFCVLRSFIKRWREEYLLPISPDERIVNYYYSIKPKNDNNNCPVESMDPHLGPFTILELKSLFDWVNDRYSNEGISTEQFIYIRLLIATGSRIRQLQQLTFGDLMKHEGRYVLRMPKAKDRGFEYRSTFQVIEIPPDLYGTLSSYRELTLRLLLDEHPTVDWKKALLNVPFFRAKGVKNKIIMDHPDLHLLESGPKELFHKQDGSMKALFVGLRDDDFFPISERTGDKIHLSAHRFRYTLGTDMARMGVGPHAIAAALGHNGVASVGRYIRTSVEMGKRIDEKMKEEIAIVINAFQGRLVSSTKEAVNGSDDNKIIRSRSGGVATCGALEGCHLDAPVACYTCSKFQPWVEGPHEEVLERLRLRQQRAIDVGGEASESAVSYDRPILAVMQVIQKIKEFKTHEETSADE